MNEHEFLLKFQETLRKEEYDCSLVEASEEIPYERLLVFLGLDEKERERILEVTALKQEFMKELGLVEPKEAHLLRVQLQVGFPFKIQPTASAQIASLVCYLNRMVELPGFEMNEIDLQLFYRYVLMYGEKRFNETLFISIVGLIMLSIELFGSTFDKVATGEVTFNELLEQIIEIAKNTKDEG